MRVWRYRSTQSSTRHQKQIRVRMPQPHNPQNPVSLRFMWLRHGHQIILNKMEKRKISCIKLVFLQDVARVYTVKDAAGYSKQCKNIHVHACYTHACACACAHTHKHTNKTNFLLTLFLTTPLRLRVNMRCTRQVLVNMEPNAREKPADRRYTLAQ